MKKRFILLMGLAALMAGCTGNGGNETPEIEAPEKENVSGISVLGDRDFEGTDTIGGKVYNYVITLKADKSLQTVTNSYGYKYYDNAATLKVMQGGQVIFNQKFTKDSFKSQVPADFEKSAFVGLVLNPDQKDGNALHFLATVGDADNSSPAFSHYVGVDVSPAGQMSLRQIANVDTERGRDDSGEDEGV